MMRQSASRTDVLVVGAGAYTSIGTSLATTAAAVRAGISTFGRHPFMVDTAGKPMIVGAAPCLPMELDGLDRWMALAMPAADEALSALRVGAFDDRRRAEFPPVSMVLGLPAYRPGLASDMKLSFPQRLVESLQDGRPFGSVSSIARGHASGLLALSAGIEEIKSGRTSLCLVGGVDSYLEPDTLEWIEGCDQLHSAGDGNNPWGFTPSEGAGFCLLAAPDVADRFGLAARSKITSVGKARESCVIKTDAVCTGQGLTLAFANALALLQAPSQQIDHIVCDMNGEPYRAEEFAFATLRHHEYFVNSADFVAPADCWGDVGAASGLLCIGLAMEAHVKGYRPGRRTLVWSSSEGGDRVAAVVEFS